MPRHLLVLESAPGAGEWVLEWGGETLSMTGPDGELLFEVPVARAHRVVELYELDQEGKVSFATEAGPMTFNKNKEAVRDVRELVLAGLRSDGEYREGQKRLAKLLIPLGLAMFFVCGGLFAWYCWWAIGS